VLLVLRTRRSGTEVLIINTLAKYKVEIDDVSVIIVIERGSIYVLIR
jgi:hypothetical protein